MKKNIIIATLVAASALLASISCTKQDDVQSVSEAKVFTATIEQGLTKTMLKEGRVFWDEKDLININGASYSATPNRDKPESATFTFVDGIAPTAPYHAIYPASLCDNGKYFFPSVQNYSEDKFNAPMYAQSSSEKLIFNNICGVICLKLRSSDDSETVVRRIVLTTKKETVWGEFSVNENGEEKWEASVYNNGDQSNTVTLDCGEDGISLNPDYDKEFFIYLPPQNYQSGMTVSIESTNPNCSAYKMYTSYRVPVECNSVYSFNWEVQFASAVQYDKREAPSKALSGQLFTVGPKDIDKVYFSKGNLQATAVECGLFDFYFADKQNNFIGEDSGNAKLFNNETLQEGDIIDLFCWSETNNTYGISESNGNSFVDWGNVVSPPQTWRTLSNDEWKYLLKERVFIDSEGEEHTGQNYSYQILSNENVEGKQVSGIVIFPDDFTAQDEWKENFSWDTIAGAGIVFLPLAGYLMTFDGYTFSFLDDDMGYWSSTQASWNDSPFLIIYSSEDKEVNTYYTANDGGNRASVRLVSNAFVPALPDAPEVIEAEEWVESEQ